MTGYVNPSKALAGELKAVERELFQTPPGTGKRGLEALRRRRERLLSLLKEAVGEERVKVELLLMENATYHLDLSEGYALLRAEDNPKLRPSKGKVALFLGLHRGLLENYGDMLSAAFFLAEEVGKWHSHYGRETVFAPGSTFEALGRSWTPEVWISFSPSLRHRHRAKEGDLHAVIKGPELQGKMWGGLEGGRVELHPGFKHPFKPYHLFVSPGRAEGRASLAVVWALSASSAVVSLRRDGASRFIEVLLKPHDLLIAEDLELLLVEGKALSLLKEDRHFP